MAEVLLERDAQLEVLVGAVAEGAAGARLDRAHRRRGGHRQDEPGARAGRARGRRGAASSWRRATTSSRRARSGPLHDAAAGQRRAAGGRAGRRGAGRSRLRRAAGGARARSARPSSSSRTSTGPTTPPSTCSATRRAGSRAVGAVLVLTIARRARSAPSAAPAARRARRLPGAPASSSRRCRATRCRRWRPAPGATPAAVHALTRGNPFFVTETLAAPPDEVPASVKDAVLARAARLWTRTAARRSSACRWCPRTSRPSWPRSCSARRCARCPRPSSPGVIEDRPDGLGFRHELARRAIESSLPVTRVRLLNQAVVAALRAQERPERARLMHHAVAAGDVDDASSRSGRRPRARPRGPARTARRSRTSRRSCPTRRGWRRPSSAAVLDDYGWELYNAAPLPRGGAAPAAPRRSSTRASATRSRSGLCLVRVSRHWFMAGETDAAEECAAARGADPRGGGRRARRWPRPRSTRAAILALAEDPEQAGAVLRARRRSWRGRRSAWTSPRCA